MPEHSKEQILAALEGLINDPGVLESQMARAEPDIVTEAGIEFAIKYINVFHRTAAKSQERHIRDGRSEAESTSRVITSLVVHSISIGFLAARRLHEIDELEAMEIT
jgi:hypothetical protein